MKSLFLTAFALLFAVLARAETQSYRLSVYRFAPGPQWEEIEAKVSEKITASDFKALLVDAEVVSYDTLAGPLGKPLDIGQKYVICEIPNYTYDEVTGEFSINGKTPVYAGPIFECLISEADVDGFYKVEYKIGTVDVTKWSFGNDPSVSPVPSRTSKTSSGHYTLALGRPMLSAIWDDSGCVFLLEKEPEVAPLSEAE